MNNIILFFVLFNCLNAFSQDIVPIDIKNAEIHDIMKNIKWGIYARTNNSFTFQFAINNKGEAINIILPKYPSDSIRLVNHDLFSKIIFQPSEDSITNVSFTVFSTTNSPSAPSDSTIETSYENELKRFENSAGDLVKFIIEDGQIIIRPWHYRTVACYSLNAYSPKRKPFWRRWPRIIKLPNKIKE